MTRRVTGKSVAKGEAATGRARRPACAVGKASRAASGSRQIRAAGETSDAPARLALLETECKDLRTRLAEAEGRIAKLERRRAEVADRIAWALDSLHTLIDEQT